MNKTEQPTPAKQESKSVEEMKRKSMDDIIYPLKDYLSYLGIPDYLRHVVTVEKCKKAMSQYATQQLSIHTQALAEENERLRKENEWISVEDRLPEEFGKYLCYIKYGDSEFQAAQWFYAEKDSNRWEDYGNIITHWRPLPSPPTISKEGEK